MILDNFVLFYIRQQIIDIEGPPFFPKMFHCHAWLRKLQTLTINRTMSTSFWQIQYWSRGTTLVCKSWRPRISNSPCVCVSVCVDRDRTLDPPMVFGGLKLVCLRGLLGCGRPADCKSIHLISGNMIITPQMIYCTYRIAWYHSVPRRSLYCYSIV